MANENSDVYPSGIAGPRRTTQEPMEIVAANAEAARIADELGISSSGRLNSARRGEVENDSSKHRRGFKLFGRSSASSVAEEESKAYQAVPSDGSARGVGLIRQPHTSATRPTSHATGYPGSGVRVLSPLSSPTVHVSTGRYQEPITSFNYQHAISQDDDVDTVRTGEPLAFDAHGHRAPYREGPYDFHHDADGRLIRKRWCKCTKQ